MSSQLNIEGNIIPVEGAITYNFQLGDVADFSIIKSNYTSSFQILKTHEVVRLFEGLGIPNDMSTYPYRITNVQCLEDYTIVYEGTLIILESDSMYYKATVISGVKTLADEFGNATLYDAGVRLTPKTLMNVRSGLSYAGAIGQSKFIVKPFTQNAIAPSGNGYRVNADVVSQGFSLQYLIDQCFAFVGIDYEFPSTISFEGEMLAVPNPPLLDIVVNGTNIVRAGHISTYSTTIVAGNPITGWEGWDFSGITPTYFDYSGNNFICIQSGSYIFSFDYFFARIRRQSEDNWFRCIVDIRVNGMIRASFTANEWDTPVESETFRTILDLVSGQIVSVGIRRPADFGIAVDADFERGETSFRGYLINLDEDKERDILSMKCVDFLKEIANRYALFIFKEGNQVEFKALYDMMSDPYIDFSDKFLQRTNEKYDLGLSQNNYLRHSYSEEHDERYDLNLESNNRNTSISRNIFKSSIFAPSKSTYNEDDYVMYTREDEDAPYKSTGRMFFVKADIIPLTGLVVMSSSIPGETFPLSGDFVGVEYTAGFIDSDRWKTYEAVFNNTKVHTIELDLSIVDISGLSLKYIYQINEENSIYFLNTLRYTRGQKSVGEFVRILCEYGWEGIDLACEQQGGINTGYSIYTNLRNYLTGEIKPNIPSDPDYIPPVYDLCLCPSGEFFFLFRLSISVTGDIDFVIDEGANVNRVEVRTGDSGEGSTISFSETSDSSKLLASGSSATGRAVVYRGSACDVTRISVVNPYFSVIDVSLFPNLDRLVVRNQLALSSAGSFDIEANTRLTYIDIRDNGFTTGSAFSILDKVIIDLDNNGQEDGTLMYADDNASGAQPSNASRVAYDSLIAKGWTITGRPPLI